VFVSEANILVMNNSREITRPTNKLQPNHSGQQELKPQKKLFLSHKLINNISWGTSQRSGGRFLLIRNICTK